MGKREAVIDEPQTRVEPVAAPEVQPVRVWAEKAGHLPERFPGDRVRPVRCNRKAWLARAVCARLKLTLDDSIDERTYLDSVADVSAVGAR